MKKKLFRPWRQICFFLLFVSPIFFGGCSSYESFRYITEEVEIPGKVFDADYHQTWQAVIQVMKPYNIATQNQESGVITTKWEDNTSEVNFSDSFGSSDAVKGAKYKITVNVVKGFRYGREYSKVSIFKRQLIEQDFLQGWKEIPSEGILEETLLYRINRVIAIDKRLKEIEKKQEEQELKNI